MSRYWKMKLKYEYGVHVKCVRLGDRTYYILWEWGAHGWCKQLVTYKLFYDIDEIIKFLGGKYEK